MATARTVFLDSKLSDYQSLVSHYDASLYEVVALTGGAQQIQDYLTAHQLTAASINVISPSTGMDGLFTPRVVFVDPSVADYQTIIAALPANTTAVVLDATRDGVQQIRDYLAHNTGQVGAIDIITDIASLDVVSHGSPGEIMLGSTVLNSASVASYSTQLAEIGSHLTAGGDILLYGCDVAAGTTGQQFIADLAHATGADVAASTDTTGSAAAGGDWVLEASTGTIETVALSSASYGGTLDAATGAIALTLSDDTGSFSSDFVTKTAVQTITGSFTASTSGNSVPTLWVSTDGTGANRTQATITYTDNAGSGTFTVPVTLSQGTKNIQFWSAQNGNNQLGTAKSYTLDTTPPAAVSSASFSNDSGASNTDFTTATAAQTISGTLSAATLTGEVVRVSLDGGSTWQTASNTIGSTTFSLSGVTLTGSNTLKIQVEDLAGNAGTTYSRAYVLDTSAPSAGTLAFSNLTDTGTPGDGITSDRTFDLALSGNEAGTTVVYQVSTNGGGSWTTTSVAQSNLANGAYQFRALVTDTAGNTSTSNTASVVVDASAPNAPTITGFSINSGSTLDTLTNDNTPTLTITAEADATVTVYQAGVAVGNATQSAPGSGIYTFTSAVLGDANYSFTAKAADAAGNLSAASGVQSITIDTTADVGGNLAVQVSDSLVSNAEKGAVAYTVIGLDADATATVTFKDASNHSVTGSNGTVNLSTLTDGPITVSISATDAAGNSATGAAAATVLDTTADVGNNLSVQVGDSLVSNAEKGTVAYTVTGLDADATATVTFKDASNHSVTGSNGTANLSTLTDGPITVSISATDAAGNSASGTGAVAVLDTTADAGNNLAVQVGDSLVSNAEKGTVAYTITGLDADATATVTFKDASNHSVTGSNGTANLSTLTDGPITVSISATDTAGNSATGAAAATVLDTTADAGNNLAVQVGDSLVSNSEKGTVAYTITGLDADATATVTFKDASNHSVTGSNGTANLSTLTDGPITVSISAIDTAGNSANGAAATTVLDTTADAGSNLAVQVSDSLVSNAEKGAVAYTITGLDADATATATFSDGVHSVTGSNGTANLSTLTDGPITVSISATDAAGNSASGTGAATVLDTTADAGSNLAVQVSDSLVSNAEKGAVAYTISGLDADATATVTFSDGVHSVTGAAGVANLSTLSDGPISVSISAADIAGNSATGTGTSTVLDTTADAGSDLAVQVSDSLVNNVEKGAVAYTISGQDADATATVTFSDGVHSVTGSNGTANLSTLTDGPITVSISAVDAAGNSANGAAAATVLDTTADVGGNLAVQVSDSLVNNAEKGAVAYTITGLDADATATVTFSDGVHSVTGAAGVANLSTLSDGPISVTISAADIAGNTATGTGAATVLDTTADAGSDLAVKVSDSLVNNAEKGAVAYTITGLDADATATVTFSDGVHSVTGVAGVANLSTLSDGPISVSISALDIAGNTATGTGAATVLDTTADAGSDLAVKVSDGLVNNAEKGAVAYTVLGLDSDATATVTFSDGVTSVIGSNGTANLSTLKDGPITVSISATDAAGNSANGAAAATVLDTTADAGSDLAVKVSDSLVNNAEKGAVAYTVTGLDADATATVTFSDGVTSVTGSNGTANLSMLKDGPITVSISTTDGAGNSASGAAAATVLDTTADAGSDLAVKVSDSLVNNAEKGAVAYTVIGLDADASATVTFNDGVTSVTGSNGTANLSTLKDGPITVSISVTDAAGNSANGAAAATVLDTTADAGNNLAVQVSDSLVSNAEKGAVAYTVIGLDSDATATVTFSDGVTSVTGSNGTANLTTLTDGPITVSISATDAAGNTASGAGAATVLDTTADVGGDLAVKVSDSLVNNAEKGAVAYTVTGLDADATPTVTFSDGVHSVTGSNGTANLSTLTDGPITVSISATDAAGNTATGAAAATVLDTTADVGGDLAVKVSDSLVNNAEKGSVAYTVLGLDSDATATVTFSDGAHSVTGSNGTANLTTLTDGPITVSISATDAAGNTASGAGAATVLDTTADVGGDLAVKVSDSLVNNAEKGAVAYTVTGLDADATPTVTFSDGVHSVTGSNGTANLSTLTDGPITVSISATDAAGNTATGAAAATVLDTTADVGGDLAVKVADSLVSNAEKGAVAYTVLGLDSDATATVTFSDGVHSVTGNNGTANLSTLTDGPIIVSISATDAAGNSANGAGTATVLDTTADVGGDLAVKVSDSLVNNAEKGSVAYTVLGLDADATATVTFSDGVHSVTGSNGTANLSSLTDGPITVSISATDAAGNTASGAGAATVLDTTADVGGDLAVKVSDSLVNNAEKGAVAYTISGLDADATATVTFSDGVHSVTGSNGTANLSTLTDGPITVSISATDAAGNTASGAGAATVLDTTADVGGDLAVKVSDSLVNNAEKGSVAYTVLGLDSDATATVTFSDGAHSVTGSNGTANLTTLTDGPITVSISATDAAGNTASGAGAATVLDTTADVGGDLAVKVSDSLVNNAEKGAVAYTVTGLDADATPTVTFSDGVHSVTGSNGTANLSTLTDGPITVSISATDAAGNTATGAAAATVLDTTADVGGDLAVKVSDSLVNNAEKGSVAYTVLGLDSDATATVTFSDGAHSVTGSNGTANLTTLTDGPITVSISATDAAGNTASGAGAATVLDTTADVGGDLAVKVSDSLVNNAEKGAVAYTVTGLDADATPTVTFSDGVHSVTGSNGTANLSTLTDGPITVSISATDAAGNTATGAAAATVLDTTADVGGDLAVKVADSLVSNAEKGAVAYTVLGLDSDATATVTFSDGVHSVTGNNGTANLSTLTDGPIIVSISATDAAGNSANGAGTATVLDTTADVGGDLAVKVSDSLVNNAEKGSVAYTVLGLDADATATVTFSDGVHSVTGSNGTANLSSLTDGPITVSISATDAAGNTASGAGAATVLDTTADVGGDLAVKVSDSLVNNAEKGAVAYTISGLDADATATVTFSDGVHSVTGSNGTANLSTLTDGPITVSISATDAAGNTASGAGAATVLDTTADVGGDLAVKVSDSLVNNAEKGSVAYTVLGLDSDATATVTFSDGAHSVTGSNGTANLTTLTDGPITVSISATDAAGNTASGAGAATVLDTTADVGGDLAVKVSDSLVNNAEKGAVAYTVTGLDADATPTVTFSDGVHSVTGSNGTANLSTLTDGPITVSISATDAAGNTATGAAAATVLDTTADVGGDLAVKVSDSLVNNAEKGAVAYTVLGLDSDATATVTFSDGVHSVTGSNGTANLSTLKDGPITVSISATDAAGNSASGTGAATVLDTTADAGSDLAVKVSDGLVNNAEKGAVAYTVLGLDSDATATVTFSDGVTSVIGSNGTANLSTLKDGPITVSISALDIAGNSAAGTGAATVLDTTADAGSDLAVKVTDSLVNNAEKGAVAYTVLGLDSDATATVTFSDGVHSVTGSNGTANLSTLTDGPITVSISATDAAGNSASGTGAATVLDTTADAGNNLAVQVSDSLVNNAEKGTVAYTVTGLDADATATVTFKDASNHSVTGSNGTANLSTLTDGPITVSISAVDAAGNSATGAGAATVLDTTSDAGSNLAVQVSDSLVSNAEKGSVAYTVTGLDADATATVIFSDGVHSVTGSNGTANLSTLKDGTITVSISATDAAGNSASGTGAATVLDTTADAGSNLAVQVSDSLVNNAEKGTVAYTVIGLDADATATVTFRDASNHSVTGSNGTANLSTLTDGPITVSISATDAAGNSANGAAAATVLDTTADVGSNLAVQVSDSLVNNAEKGAVAYTITGLDADATATVTFKDASNHSVTGSNGTANLSTLTDGTITVSISATDTAGNSATGTAAATVLDTTADVGGNLAVQVSDSLVSNAEKGAVAYTINGLDADANATVTFSDGVHTAIGSNGLVNLSGLTDGAIAVSVSATDYAGNVAQGVAASLTLDTTAPVFTSAATATLAENSGANMLVYQAGATDARAFSYSLLANNNDDAGLVSLGTDGAVSLYGNPDFESKSKYNFTIVATDDAGNASQKAVTLNIGDVNEAPTAAAISLSTVENAAIVIPVIPDYAFDLDAGDAVKLMSVGQCTLSWASDTTATTFVNPVTKQVLGLSQVYAKATMGTDGKTITILPSDEFDWASTGQKVNATVSYSVCDNAGMVTSNTITLTIWGSTADKGKILNGGNGNDTLTGTDGENVMQGANGNDTLTGGAATDALYGGNGDDKVYGNGGIDYLYGDLGNDLLDGGAARDVLFGGKGNDTLIGGYGADCFVFEAQMGNDRVSDFRMSEGDKLYFVDIFSKPITAAEFVSKYVTHVGNDLLISVPGGSVTLVGVSDTAALVNAIAFTMPT
ncbi:Ig-like domain-containing protein [Pseudoduganella sp. UC29_106]|uniref:Ig-like domain-containing protein n=1 Tax=Pseudoduganella sp. UC29_106 TaxID=3374553 RepID=UPI00375727A1